MSDVVMAFGIGNIIGIFLFLVLAFTGHIDKWTRALEDKWSGVESETK